MAKLIVVTGGAGFIGSHLCERLVAQGHRVISLDNYFTGSKENHVPGVEYRTGHTKDIEAHISETPDLVYHLGEYARVEQSVLEPDIVEDLNTVGTKGVIEFWKKKKCKLVYAGSSTKFGDGGEARYTSPYASTKAANTEKVKEVGEREHLPYAITYFYNVYGERERSGVYGTVIEHFKRMYLSGAPCAIVSPGTQERNFTHVADIVDGLIAVGERGMGDEHGLGNVKAHSVFSVAEMFGFGDNTIMFPPRPGNRMTSALDTRKVNALGWTASRELKDYINEFTKTRTRGKMRDKRVLVLSTTLHPIAGLAEEAFVELARAIPDVSFDVITTKFTAYGHTAAPPAPNLTVYRLGVGKPIDKFLLPILGSFKALELTRSRSYLFMWSLMASYAALTGFFVKFFKKMPLLITLGDQNLDDLSPFHRMLLSLMLSRADQVYGTHGAQEAHAMRATGRTLPRNSVGEGDAFANALRYAYADIVRREQGAYVKKKRVLIFSLAYYPYVGGAEVAIKEITDRISDIEFHMVTLRFKKTDAPVEKVGNVLVHRIGGSGQIGKGLFQFAAFFKAQSLNRKYHYDATWAMMAHSSGVPAALFKTFNPRVGYVLTLQEGDPPEYVERKMAPFGPLFARAFTKADVIQTISTFLGMWAKRMGYRGEPILVPNGVDLGHFKGNPTSHSDTILITTSRLVHKNAIDDVVRALPNAPVTFTILGTGPEEASLKALAAQLGVTDRVHFLGHIDHASLPKYLHAADIFIRPSRSEGMGNSFIEAMAAGLPVIATQEGGLSDFINSETAWVVRKDSPDDIAAAISDIIAHPEKVNAVTAAASRLVVKYDWDLVARDMREKIFEEVLHG